MHFLVIVLIPPPPKVVSITLSPFKYVGESYSLLTWTLPPPLVPEQKRSNTLDYCQMSRTPLKIQGQYRKSKDNSNVVLVIMPASRHKAAVSKQNATLLSASYLYLRWLWWQIPFPFFPSCLPSTKGHQNQSVELFLFSLNFY